MDPQQRIDSWIRFTPTDHSGFIRRVHDDGGVATKTIWYNNVLPLNKAQQGDIINAYKIIHCFIKDNKPLFNSGDATRLENLADRLVKIGSYTSCKDREIEKLYSFAQKLKNLKPQEYEVPVEEFSNIPLAIKNLIIEYFSLMDVIEVLTCGQPVSPEIIQRIFLNPSSEALKAFLDKVLRFNSQDRTVAYVRTFCRHARNSPQAVEWLVLLLIALSNATNEILFNPMPLAEAIVDAATPRCDEKEYLSQIEKFLYRHACFKESCSYNCSSHTEFIKKYHPHASICQQGRSRTKTSKKKSTNI